MTLSPVRRTALAIVAATLATAIVAPAVQAQAVPTGATPVRYYRGVIGLNPLGIPFDIVSIEAEGAVAPGITAAAALSHFAPDDDRFTSGDVKLRYYPGETALDGFSVGLGVGFTKRSSTECTYGPDGQCTSERQSATGPTLSALADYNFLLGQRRRFFVGTGVGAKRWMVSRETRERLGAERAWVFGRFLVGLAF
jgi:opacity protein-like surface antigen